MVEEIRCKECSMDFSNLGALSMHNSIKHNITTKEKKSSPRRLIMIIAIIVIIFIISSLQFVYNSSGKNSVGNAINNLQENKNSSNLLINSEIQKITLSMKGDYYPNTIKVKLGVPIEITLDSSVQGCYRSFSIPELGVSKYLLNLSDTVKFTPNKKGTFRFQCSMGMGKGTIIIA